MTHARVDVDAQRFEERTFVLVSACDADAAEREPFIRACLFERCFGLLNARLSGHEIEPPTKAERRRVSEAIERIDDPRVVLDRCARAGAVAAAEADADVGIESCAREIGLRF